MAKSSKKKSKAVAARWQKLSLRVGAWTVALFLLAAAGWFGARKVWAAVAARPEFQLDLREFSLGSAPPYVNAEALSARLREDLSVLPERTSIFEPAAAKAVHDVLSSSPWVLRVQEVARCMPNSLLVRAVFRKPAGLVLWEGKKYMIDADGYPLPEHFFRIPPDWNVERIPAIVDRLLRHPPPYGRPWGAPRLAIGARLSDFLREHGLFDALRVTTIDVTGVDRGTAEADIVLNTASGAEVRWGHSDTYAAVGLEEPPFMKSDAEKLNLLMGKLHEYPHLRGIRYLDLRYHGKIYFTPAGPQDAGPSAR